LLVVETTGYLSQSVRSYPPSGVTLTYLICSLYGFGCDLNLSLPCVRPKGDAGKEAEDRPIEVSQGDSASPSEQCTSDCCALE